MHSLVELTDRPPRTTLLCSSSASASSSSSSSSSSSLRSRQLLQRRLLESQAFSSSRSSSSRLYTSTPTTSGSYPSANGASVAITNAPSAVRSGSASVVRSEKETEMMYKKMINVIKTQKQWNIIVKRTLLHRIPAFSSTSSSSSSSSTSTEAAGEAPHSRSTSRINKSLSARKSMEFHANYPISLTRLTGIRASPTNSKFNGATNSPKSPNNSNSPPSSPSSKSSKGAISNSSHSSSNGNSMNKYYLQFDDHYEYKLKFINRTEEQLWLSLLEPYHLHYHQPLHIHTSINNQLDIEKLTGWGEGMGDLASIEAEERASLAKQQQLKFHSQSSTSSSSTHCSYS